jgi:hypothetical protein
MLSEIIVVLSCARRGIGEEWDGAVGVDYGERRDDERGKDEGEWHDRVKGRREKEKYRVSLKTQSGERSPAAEVLGSSCTIKRSLTFRKPMALTNHN